MKTKTTPRGFSSEPLAVTVPRGFSELTPEQFTGLCRLMVSGIDADDLTTVMFMRLAGLRVLAHTGDGRVLVSTVSRPRRTALLAPAHVAVGAESLRWLTDIPPLVAFQRFAPAIHRSAIAFDLSSLDFGAWLALDNSYAGYLFTHRDDLVDRMAVLMTPRLRHPKPWQRFALLLWMRAAKDWLAVRFPHFFSGPDHDDVFASGGTPEDVRVAMEAQIRALTKGDVTRESDVLSVPVMSALTELDQLAREYQDLKKISK